MQETWVQSWVEKIPCRRIGNPLQYSFLGNSMDRGAWQATVHGITESDRTEHSIAIHVLLLTIVSQLVIIG